LTSDLLKALPNLSLGRSLLGVLGDYFKEDKLKLSFTFQSKYLGMSAWECPGAFAILPYVEHAFGVYHVMGGLSEISEAMAKVCRELGVKPPARHAGETTHARRPKGARRGNCRMVKKFWPMRRC